MVCATWRALAGHACWMQISCSIWPRSSRPALISKRMVSCAGGESIPPQNVDHDRKGVLLVQQHRQNAGDLGFGDRCRCRRTPRSGDWACGRTPARRPAWRRVSAQQIPRKAARTQAPGDGYRPLSDVGPHPAGPCHRHHLGAGDVRHTELAGQVRRVDNLQSASGPELREAGYHRHAETARGQRRYGRLGSGYLSGRSDRRALCRYRLSGIGLERGDVQPRQRRTAHPALSEILRCPR